MSLKTSFLIVFALGTLGVSAQNNKICKTHAGAVYTAGPTRSDTFDIQHTTLEFDFTDWSSKELDARADLVVVPKMSGITSIRFDLLGLTVDSVYVDSTLTGFTYNSPVLSIPVSFVYSPNPIPRTITIFYRGQPTTDASGWGGFYYGSNIAYNLGVGFDADPHNYGRTWFPCFDQFIERSTFTLKTRTQGGRISQATGVRTSEQIISGDTLFTQWEMNQPIPSYLVGLAVGRYYRYTDNYSSITGAQIPIEIAAQANDTADVPGSFSHLIDALQCYESWYGPYQWDRIGYVLTGQGAMEHPTNVAYPAFTVDGTNAYDGLIAHELAHHWWGDYVTCSQAEHMWINEGMAEFNSHLFFECLNGRESYLKQVRGNWYTVLKTAHQNDGGFLAIDGVGHSNTYGTHVYYKGAGMVHSMRGYLGDSLFAEGLQAVLTNRALDTVSSAGFEQILSSTTGVNMGPFFENWIYEPGFVQFGIDEIQMNTGASTIDVTVSQGLRATQQQYDQVPLEIGLYDSLWNLSVEQVTLGVNTANYTLPNPGAGTEWVILDPNEKLMTGTTYEQEVFYGPINRNIGRCDMSIDVLSESDSSWVRREHHWAGPRGTVLANNGNAQISVNHYWSVRGSLSNSFHATASMRYDGRNGQLDDDLVNVTEDSLIVLYRAPGASEWVEFPYYTKDVMGSPVNRLGRVIIDSLLLGDYAFANGVSAIGLDDPRGAAPVKLYPNPTRDQLILEGLSEESAYTIYNASGQAIRQGRIDDRQSLSVLGLTAGSYRLRLGSSFLPFTVVK